jgi:hypothetical protein
MRVDRKEEKEKTRREGRGKKRVVKGMGTSSPQQQ